MFNQFIPECEMYYYLEIYINLIERDARTLTEYKNFG